MTSFCVLPTDIIETLTAQLSEEHPAANGLAFLRLPHPRTGIPCLFLPAYGKDANQSSILELQSISPNASRSWFHSGQVVSDGSLKLMAPIDPAFLLLPLLRAVYPNSTTGNFRTADDILEDAATKLAVSSGQTDADNEIRASDVLDLGKLDCVQTAMRRICDVKDITDDLVVYRYSEEKLLGYLSRKAERISRTGIIDQSRTLERELQKDGLFDNGKDALLQSGRLRLACDTISQYLPPDLYESLLARFDFSALNAHIEILKAASMAIEPQNACKDQNGDSLTEKDGKKRKAAGQGSRGVEKLKKVNVKGMAKLSTFFQKTKV